jgi:hypothetical protein
MLLLTVVPRASSHYAQGLLLDVVPRDPELGGETEVEGSPGKEEVGTRWPRGRAPRRPGAHPAASGSSLPP